MPFGEHKGTPVARLPDGYLAWLNNRAELYGQLKVEVAREYARRFREEAEHSQIARQRLSGISPKMLDVCRKIVEAGYKDLAVKNHPDRGGDTRAMAAINQSVDILRRLLS